MKGKLIKLYDGSGYRLDDKNGSFVGSTILSAKTKLSLKNCQAIERGYDLDELATCFANKELQEEHGLMVNFYTLRTAYLEGMETILEILGDKKFSENNLDKAFDLGKYVEREDCTENYLAYKQSLQKKEWDVEIVQEPAKSSVGKGETNYFIPKLDADSRLILKRINDE